MRLCVPHVGAWVYCGPTFSLSADDPAVASAGEGVTPPQRLYRKAIVRTGQFYKSATGQSFEITPATIAGWVNTFEEMRANGVRVPIPNTHAGFGDPAQNRGYVMALWPEPDPEGDGQTLYMLALMIGQDAFDAAARCDVSISVPSEFIDGEGHVYTAPIQHVALVTNPVITGLGEFVPVAASLNDGASEMDLIGKLAQVLSLSIEAGCAPEKAAEMILAAVEQKCANTKECADEVTCPKCGNKFTPGDQRKDAAPKDEQVTVMRGEGGGGGGGGGDGAGEALSADGKVVEASHSAAVTNKSIVKLVGDARRTQLDDLLRTGCITKAVRDDFERELLGEDNAVLALSLGKGDDGTAFNTLIETLRKNRPTAMGGKTAAQVADMALADPHKTDDASSLIRAAEKRRAEFEKQTAAR